MSSLITCKVKNQFDRYATAKSGGELLLTVALIADVAKEIYDLVQGRHNNQYFEPLLALASVSLGLQVIALILAFILACSIYPTKVLEQVDMEAPRERFKVSIPQPPPRVMRAMNDILTVITGVLMILHITRKTIQGTINPTDILAIT